MLYKSNFCAECGEKIDRQKTDLLASRRFCEDCARIFENPHRIKKAVAIAAIFIIGILAGQIVQPTKQAVMMTSSRPQNLIAATGKSNVSTNVQNQSAVVTSVGQSANVTDAQQVSSKTNGSSSLPAALETQRAPEKSKSYCGAKTQKGTPCTRRVNSGQRCWQHAGKPAMLPANKLLIR